MIGMFGNPVRAYNVVICSLGNSPAGRTWSMRSIFVLRYVVYFVLVVSALMEGALQLFGGFLGDAGMNLEERRKRWREATQVMLEERKDALAVFDPVLGWRPQAGLSSGPNVINRLGLRSTVEYTVKPPKGKTRVSVFGDSFVYGSGVQGTEAWPSILENAIPGIEVLNYGVPGYGPDQAYLRFRAEFLSVNPHIAIFAISTPALRRILNRSAVFLGTSPDFVAKPRYILDAQEELILLPNPIQKLSEANRFVDDPSLYLAFGQFDYWYDPRVFDESFLQNSAVYRAVAWTWSGVKRRYLDPDRPYAGFPFQGQFNRSSSAFKILVRLIHRFREDAIAAGVRPVILVLPDNDSMVRYWDGKAGTMDPLTAYCMEEGLACIDATEAFRLQPRHSVVRDWFVDGFHYSVEGNRIVAQWLAQKIDFKDLHAGGANRSPAEVKKVRSHSLGGSN